MPPMGFFILAGMAVVASVVLYVSADYTYGLEGDELRMRRVILGGVPYGQRVVKLSNIKRVRLLSFRRDWRVWEGFAGAEAFGNVYARRSVLVELKRRQMLIVRAFHITPDDPEAFVAELNRGLEP